MNERKSELANELVLSLTPVQRQAMAALLLRGGDDGECAIEDQLTGILYDDECSLKEQFNDLPDCFKCGGLGTTKRVEKDILCSQCKGLGKFDPVLPNFAVGLSGEQMFVSDLYAGHEDPWEKYPDLAEELISGLQIEEGDE